MINSTGIPRPWFAIAALYLILAIAYAFATPPLESSDEYKHYPVVEYVARTGQLVVLDPAEPGKWLQEGAQPPLYYLVMAGLTGPIDTADLDEVHQINPHAFVGNPNQLHNKNIILHDPAKETFPWSGTILAVMLIRFVSIGFGIGTLWFTYTIGRDLFSEEIGLLAAGLTAVNPMFLFISAAVNNDSLSALLGAWGVWLLLRLWQSLERGEPFKLMPLVWLGLICGLGMLTKLSLATILLLAGVIVTWQAWHKRDPWILFGRGPIIAGIALILVAPWLVRNLNLYGDLTGLAPFIEVQGTRDNPTIAGVNWLAEWGTFYRSYWGLFGGVNVLAPNLFYVLCNTLFAIGVGGLALPARPKQKGGLWLLPMVALILMILLVRWNIISPAFQGRLIFPGLAGINVLWAAGLFAWRYQSSLPARSGPALIGALGVVALLLTWPIRAAYAYPTPLESVPTEAQFGPYTYTDATGNAIQLVGLEIEPAQTAVAGRDDRPFELTLYWQLPATTDAKLLTAVDVLGRDLDSIGRVNRYPGLGMWPTDRWEAGEIYADRYRAIVGSGAETPTLGRIRVGVANLEIGAFESDALAAELVATDPNGAEIPLVLVGEGRVESDGGQAFDRAPAERLDIQFEEGVLLHGRSVEIHPDRIDIDLFWEISEVPQTDYTIFVQLLDADGVISSGDAPPLNNDFPTSYWRPGDRLIDPHSVSVPAELEPGIYRLAIGLYDPISGRRLNAPQGDAIIWDVSLP